MRGKMKMTALAAGFAAAGLLGAVAASGFGGSGPSPLGTERNITGHVSLERAAAGSGPASAAGGGGPKKPQITHLITTDPLTVEADGELVVVLKCPKKQKPVTGGAITPAAPANVLISLLSRFNPNTLAAPSRRFYVGVRNEDEEARQWLATLTCMKNVKEK